MGLIGPSFMLKDSKDWLPFKLCTNVQLILTGTDLLLLAQAAEVQSYKYKPGAVSQAADLG